MRASSTFTACVFVLALPAIASAEEDGDRSSSKVRLMGNSGLGSPVGLMGGTFTYAPVPEMQFEIGSGIGFSGLQFSLMPKLSIGQARDRLVFGVGPSVGIIQNPNPSQWCVSLWLNAEAGYEFRSVGGFSFLIAAGVLKGLAGKMQGIDGPVFEDHPDDRPVPPEEVASFPILPEGRIAFGRWF